MPAASSNSKETVTLQLPSGEMVDAEVPAGLSDENVKAYARMKRPDLFGAPAGGTRSIKPPQTPEELRPSMSSSGMQLPAVSPSMNPKLAAAMPGAKMDPSVGTAIIGSAAAIPATLAGSRLAQLARAYPRLSTMAAIEGSHYLPGAAGRLARRIPTWMGLSAGEGKGAPAAERARLPEQVLDATGENRPFAGGMDEYSEPPPAPAVPQSAVGRPPLAQQLPDYSGTPAVQDPSTIMPRLRSLAQQIHEQEASTPPPVDPNADLTGILQESVRQARAQRGLPQSVAARPSLAPSPSETPYDPFDEMAAYQSGRGVHGKK